MAGGLEDLSYLRQQEIQRVNLRQFLLQEQIDQQNKLDTMLHEQQLRAIGEHLQEFPDLQEHYNRLLFNEQLQRHGERALMREQAHAQIRYQEEWRRQQERLVQQVSSAASASNAASNTTISTTSSAAAQQHQSSPAASPVSTSAIARLRDLANDSLTASSSSTVVATAKKAIAAERERKRSASVSKETANDIAISPPPAKRQAREPKSSEKKAKLKNRSPGPIIISKKQHATPLQLPTAPTPGITKFVVKDNFSVTKKPRSSLMNVAAIKTSQEIQVIKTAASPLERQEKIIRHGNVKDLLSAAASKDKFDEAVDALKNFKCVTWPNSEPEKEIVVEVDTDTEVEIEAQVEAESQKLEPLTPLGFTPNLPNLPVEPCYEESLYNKEGISSVQNGELEKIKNTKKKDEPSEDNETGKNDSLINTSQKFRTVSNVLDYPYPIDTWWPTSTGVRRERRSFGENSDEDDFAEESQLAKKTAPYRACAQKIRSRLSRDLKPGVLEKLPHCKIHRLLMKRKKNISAPELVHCWQVTEIYPNDMMVCCSVCGTWRHAACGGHHTPHSVRDNIKQAVTPICDFCKREEACLRDYPEGQQRLERQRLEQLRRGLATSAVMRQASFSKHGGTYKWPLGRVSATHIGGHTRSVHSRHDKAEKQWSDMVYRLGRNGYRPKERVRVRTKELERLLVSVEDAEAHTDRHNMLLFLLGDTSKKHPVGFGNLRRNIFDPEEDEICELESTEVDIMNQDLQSNIDKRVDAELSATEDDWDTEDEHTGGTQRNQSKIRCMREGCRSEPRFDSLFCSDSCGVSSLESDLLRTFQESSDVHPSVLRN